MPFKIEFIVPGRPTSLQASSAARTTWRAAVAAAATVVMAGQPPTTTDVAVTITVFHRGRRGGDADNLIKPIQDAMNRLVYADDRQVTESTCRRRDLGGSFRMAGVSVVLATAFAANAEFVHVVVADPPDPCNI